MQSASVPPMTVPEIDKFKMWLERWDLNEDYHLNSEYRKRINELLNQEMSARVLIDQADSISKDLRSREEAVNAHEKELSQRERAVEATKVQIENEKLQTATMQADINKKVAGLDRLRHELDAHEKATKHLFEKT